MSKVPAIVKDEPMERIEPKKRPIRQRKLLPRGGPDSSCYRGAEGTRGWPWPDVPCWGIPAKPLIAARHRKQSFRCHPAGPEGFPEIAEWRRDEQGTRNREGRTHGTHWAEEATDPAKESVAAGPSAPAFATRPRRRAAGNPKEPLGWHAL